MKSPLSLTDYCLERIKGVHDLSVQYNGNGKRHILKLLEMVKSHADEIEELYFDGDPHFSIEVGDLLVLCHELLMSYGDDANEILEECYGRFERKLQGGNK